MSAKIEPELCEAIRRHKRQDKLVHAAFTLKNASDGKLLSPERTSKVVKRLVDLASSKTAKKPARVVVFKNMQSFSIDAPASFIEELTNQDDISTAALGS